MFPFSNKVGVGESCASETKTENRLATKRNVVGPSETEREAVSTSTGLGNSNIFQIESTKALKYKSLPEERLVTITNINKTDQLNENEFSFEIPPENVSAESGQSNTGVQTGELKTSSADEKCTSSTEENKTDEDITMHSRRHIVTFQLNDNNNDVTESQLAQIEL